MRILDEKNKMVDMNTVEVNKQQHYCILDYSDPMHPDYYFIPMIFIEQFNCPAADLKIGPYRVQIPLEWSIVIGEKDLGDLEVVRVDMILDKDFSAFVMNPINGYQPEFLNIDVVDIFPDVKWYAPKLKNGHILAVPLSNDKNPKCIYTLRDTNKVPDSLEIMKMV